MPRKSSKRKPTLKKRSKGKRNHAYEIVKPNARLAPRSLVSLGQIKIRKGTLLSVFLLAVLTLFIRQFFATSRFYVYDAEVQGNQFVHGDEIYDASGLNELSIFWVKPRQVEAAIIDSLPEIKEARVTCRLPNRVSIEVVESWTQVIWQRDGMRYGVDDEGAILLLEGESEGMLVIQDLRTGPFEVGDHIDPGIVVSALELRRLLPETVSLQYSEAEGLIFDQWGYPVYFGTGDMAGRVAVLNALRRDFGVSGIQPEYVDVRFPESPVYSY